MKILPALISTVIIIAQLLALPSRGKKLLQNAGNCILPLKRRGTAFLPIAAVACILINGLVVVRSFEPIYTYLLCATSALAFYITCREHLSARFGGMYDTGIFLTGTFIPYSDIQAFPAATWQDFESYLADKLSFEIQTSSNSVTISFSSTEECAKAAHCLLEQVPRLKK